MASNVVVLLPQGKRQVVKTTPAMSLKAVVNTVCEKHGISDSSGYALTNGRNILDLSLSIRFANLVQGAKLELIKVASSSSKPAIISIALQLEDGGRLMDKFPNSITLWEILKHFEIRSNGSLNLTMREDDPRKHQNKLKRLIFRDKPYYLVPAILVFEKEYTTVMQLKQTTLADVGLSSGNALVRVIFKLSDKTLEEMLPDINMPIPEKNPLPAISSKQQNDTNEVKVSSSPADNSSSNAPSQSNQDENRNLGNKNEGDAISLTSGIPSETDHSSVEKPIEREQAVTRGPSESAMSTRPQSQDNSCMTPEPPSTYPFTSRMSAANDSSTVRQSNTSKSTPKQESPQESYQLSRDVKLLMPPPENAESFLSRIYFPPEFYELSSEEIKAHLKSIQHRKKREENAPLKTSAMRQKEEKELMNKHPKTMIRIKFPDRYQLQIVFWTTETIQTLYEILNSHLQTEKDFYLYTTPPLRKLSDLSQTFWNAKLTPASVVYISFPEYTHANPNSTSVSGSSTPATPSTTTLLKPETVSLREPFPTAPSDPVIKDVQMMSAQSLKESRSNNAEENRYPHDDAEHDDDHSRKQVQWNQLMNQSIEEKDSKSKLLPKWLKLSKK